MGLLTIGEFARQTRLTPKALRLYDRLGLLRPAAVDPESGYRLYDPRQLRRARLVARLREIDMPLAEIREVCAREPGAAADAVAAYWQRVTTTVTQRSRLAALLVEDLSEGDTTMSGITFRVAARSDIGAVRDTNQDAAYAGDHLLAVADGGGPDGSAAAAAAIGALTGLDGARPDLRTSLSGPEAPRPDPPTSPTGLEAASPDPRTSPTGLKTAGPDPRTSPAGLEAASPDPRTSPTGLETAGPDPRTSPTGVEAAGSGPRTSLGSLDPRASLAGLEAAGLDPLAALAGAVAEADRAVGAIASEPISTLTALLRHGSRLALVHVGDSRAYLLRGGGLSQLTQDHSWVQGQIAAGALTPAEAATHEKRALLVRALGAGGPEVDADLAVRTVLPGDRYLLCTDGLWAVVGHAALQNALAADTGPDQIVRDLIELATAAGAPDNIACAVAEAVSGADV